MPSWSRSGRYRPYGLPLGAIAGLTVVITGRPRRRAAVFEAGAVLACLVITAVLIAAVVGFMHGAVLAWVAGQQAL